MFQSSQSEVLWEDGKNKASCISEKDENKKK